MTQAAFLAVVTVLLAGVSAKQRSCSGRDDCPDGTFCFEGRCRRTPCTVSSQCEEKELCKYGDVYGRRKTACFPADDNDPTVASKTRFCSGGGRAVFNFELRLATCDQKISCPEGAVCNPLYGVCCTKLKTCPLPSKTQMNTKTGRPIMCQLKGGTIMQCPAWGYCETQTGFCCTITTEEEKRKVKKEKETEEPSTLSELLEKEKGRGREIEKPWRGSSCQPQIGCSGSAACICGSKNNCRCECAAEFGYTVAADGKTCQRIRRRLKEKCKSDMECSAAFSECATGGCRCKRGFQRDGDGGCKPINYQCVNRQPPLVQDNAVVTCNLRMSPPNKVRASPRTNRTSIEVSGGGGNNSSEADVDSYLYAYHNDASNSSLLSLALYDNERDDCPDGHYCVPVFDNPLKKGYYQGFCCPAPSEIIPVCPVGVPHDTSHYPDFGCKECPGDHYCHRDSVSTDKEICCPKPCPSLEDIYLDGQCLTIAYYGDSCTVSAQCVYHKDIVSEDEYTQLTQMECGQNICQCPAGYTFSEGMCIRVMCTVGLRGEPLVDRFNNLIRCDRSGDCAQGHMCDPNTKVCCKGINRCPKDYVETGQLCTDDNCMGTTEICHRTSKGKAKICCRMEDSSDYIHSEERLE